MIPEDILNDKATDELSKVKEKEKTVDTEKLIYRASEYTYSFKIFRNNKNFWQRHL